MSQFYDLASLVMLPSGYRSGKVYSQKPLSTDGELTFTRNSNATRVNADGLVEKVRTNLVLQSQAFGTAPWGTQIVGTGVTPVITQNNATAPDGTQTADTVFFDAGAGTSGDRSLIIQNVTLGAGTYSGSFYARVASGTGQLVFRQAGASTYTTANLTTTWQRFSSIETTAGATFAFEIGIRRGLPNEPINASVTVEIWGAQLEASDFGPTQYIPTTSAAVSVGPTANVPRLDYSGACPSLLLEPQRTNLFLYSENLSGAYSQITSVTRSTNTQETLSPNGYYNATKLVGTGSWAFRDAIAGTSTGTYTVSCYVKAVNDGVKNTFRLSAGGAVSSDLTATNEWVRYTYTSTNGGATTNGIFRDSLSSDCEIYVYGFQCELGSYETSLIPTLGATVTRLKDNTTQTDVSGLLGAGTGTAFIDFVIDGPDVGGNIPLTIGAGVVDLVYVWVRTTLGIQYEAYKSGVLQCSISTSAGYATYGSRYKIAVVWANNDFAMYINGTLIGTDTNGTAPTPTKLWLGQYTSSNYDGATINQTLLFPTRLTNAQLAELTTL